MTVKVHRVGANIVVDVTMTTRLVLPDSTAKEFTVHTHAQLAESLMAPLKLDIWEIAEEVSKQLKALE